MELANREIFLVTTRTWSDINLRDCSSEELAGFLAEDELDKEAEERFK